MERDLTLYHKMKTFIDPEKEAFETIVGKGANAGNQHYLFPNVLYSIKEKLLESL